MVTANKTLIEVGASASGVQGGVNQAKSDVVIFRGNGTWDSTTLSINVWQGVGEPQSPTDAGFVSEYTMNANEGVEYTIGTYNYWTLTASGGGASADIDFTCQSIKSYNR